MFFRPLTSYSHHSFGLTLFIWFLLSVCSVSLLTHAEFPAPTAKPKLPLVSMDAERVTASFENLPLWQVLEALAGPLKFQAHVDPSLAPLPVTESLTSVPATKVLDRLLSGANYAWVGRDLYVWPRDTSSPSDTLVTEKWTVVSAEKSVNQVPPSLEALRDEAIHAQEGADRLQALEDLMQVGDEDTVVAVLQEALVDDDPQVRSLALEGLENVEGPTVHDAMVHVAQHDPVPEHRAQSLIWIVEHHPEEAFDLLQAALREDDPDMQEFAQELLDELQGGESAEEEELED